MIALRLHRLAIEWALRKPAPSSIPLSNLELIRDRNYYSVKLKGEREFLCDSVTGENITGRWIKHIPNDIEQINAEISFTDAYAMQLEIRQYLGEMEYHYHNSILFIIAHIFGIPWLKLWRRRFASALYKRKHLVIKDQLELLTYLADRARHGSFDPISTPQLITEIYGIYIWEHPDRDRISTHYNLWLNALVESGDVEDVRGRFRIRSQGLTTLAQEERDDRRHRDAVRTQWILAALTACIVIISLFGTLMKG